MLVSSTVGKTRVGQATLHVDVEYLSAKACHEAAEKQIRVSCLKAFSYWFSEFDKTGAVVSIHLVCSPSTSYSTLGGVGGALW